DKLNAAQADYRSAQEKVNQLLEGSTPGEQQQNNANVDEAKTGLEKALDTVGRSQDTLKTGTAARQTAVTDAQRTLTNAQQAAAQHTKDLQLDIDQVAQRLGEHTNQLNIHQAKFNFDSQQADGARAAEVDTLNRIDAERATLAAIEQRQRDNNCGATSNSGGQSSNTTSTTAGSTAKAASTKGNVAAPIGFNATQ